MKRTKQTFWRALAIATALLTMPATVCADSAFSGGNGSMTSPYIINTVADLRQLAEDVNNGNTYEGKYFNQYYDIDFGGEKLMPIGGKKYEVYDPTVGAFTNGERAFLGHYDGYYKQIKNVNIIQPDDFISAGLFGCISSEAVVECVLISGNTTISGTGNCGAIVGTLAGLATVKKCHVSSDVVVQVEQGAPTTTNYSYGGVAGLVAKANSTIEECSSQALVTDQAIAGKRVGGLVGRNQGKIKNCYSLGRVASVGTRGNFVGDNTGGTIINGYYNTSVRVGEVNGADVDEVKWIGTILGGDGVDCNILAPDYLFVENRFTQNKYYLAGEKVYLRPTYNAPPLYVVNSVTYRSNVQLADDTYNGESCLSFTMPETNVKVTADADLSIREWEGEGTPSVPYLIASVEDMQALALKCETTDFTGVHFRLTANLDYTGAAYVPVGSTAHPFNGTFDGYFRTISNVALTCDGDSQGLFGCIGSAGSVSSLYLSASSINGNGHNSIGAIAGTNGGTITMCHVLEDVDVRGGTSVGCAAGEMTGGEISYCELAATVVGTGNVGGIVGYSHSAAGCSIIENLMDGRVGSSGGYAGGIVGRNEGSMELMGCYNSATVKSVVGAGGIVGCDDGGTVSDCMNFAAVICDDAAGGIAGTATAQSTLVNNYYHGQCEAGGINGADVTGQAMRGYIVSSDESEVFFQMFPDDEGNFVGITYDGIFYLGAGETSKLLIDCAEGAPDGPFVVSAGTLTPLDEEYDDRTDLFYLLTMPTPGQDVTISIMGALMGDLDGNGVLEVNDVVILAELAMSGGATAEQILIGDLDGSGTIDVNDVVMLSGMVMGS